MPLSEQLEKLYSRRRFGIKPGVDRVKELLGRLGDPQNSFPIVHIAGTNGKGSTAAFLSSILSSSGKRTGLFTSPHLVSFNERFSINGAEINDIKLLELLSETLKYAPEDATFFEIITAMGLLFFASEKVDVAIMEAGMGGKSDATAACIGFMTLLTPISLDHTEYLGTTLEEITIEKSGIARSDTTLIIGVQPPSIHNILTTLQIDCKNINRLENHAKAIWNNEGSLDYHGEKTSYIGLKPGIGGRYQSDNAALAIFASEHLQDMGWEITSEAIISGIQNASWPGRMELVQGKPPLLLDGAHNCAGMAALCQSLNSMKQYNSFRLVLGVMADKEISAIIANMPDEISRCYCVSAQIERAMPAEKLKDAVARHGFDACACVSVAEGITMAKNESLQGEAVVVCGSLFVVGEAKAWLLGKQFEGIRG